DFRVAAVHHPPAAGCLLFHAGAEDLGLGHPPAGLPVQGVELDVPAAEALGALNGVDVDPPRGDGRAVGTATEVAARFASRQSLSYANAAAARIQRSAPRAR